jgi:hypothetical protein
MKDKIEIVFKLAKTEAEWLKYYGHQDTRLSENFEDIDFYDRIQSIGYCKRKVPIYDRCPVGYVNCLDVNNFEIVTNIGRNHSKSTYTTLEFVIYNKIDGYLDLVQIIKG